MNINWLPEIEWKKKAAEQGKTVEEEEFEDLTEDAKRLQEQELQKVTAGHQYINTVEINIPLCLHESAAALGIFL